MPLITGIRVGRSVDGSHNHIVGVWTSDGSYRNNRQVVESMKRGEVWHSSAGESRVRVGWIRWCPGMNCGEGPYLISTGDQHKHIATGLHIMRAPKSPDALENLPSTGSPPPLGASQRPERAEGGREAVGATRGGDRGDRQS